MGEIEKQIGEEEKFFETLKAEGACPIEISYEIYMEDVEKTIARLSKHYESIHISYCKEPTIESQFWYSVPYLKGKLWKFASKYVVNAVRKYAESHHIKKAK